MRLCIGASRRGELSDSADSTDAHYQRAKQHASSAADSAGDAVDEASTSAARRFGIRHCVCLSASLSHCVCSFEHAQLLPYSCRYL